MKNLFYLAFAMLFFNACSDDETPTPTPRTVPTEEIKENFKEHFVSATDATWSERIGKYNVARFAYTENATRDNLVENSRPHNTEAWYVVEDGSCGLIKSMIVGSMNLPKAVETSLEKWIDANEGYVVDELIQCIERGEDLLYKIIAINAKPDIMSGYELFFDTKGTLLSAFLVTNDDYNYYSIFDNNIILSAKMKKYIDENYTNAIVFDVNFDEFKEYNIDNYFVKILAEGVNYTLEFTYPSEEFVSETVEL